MDGKMSANGTQKMIDWRHISSNMVSDPLVRQIPHLELKLEHPGLEPAGHGERFFPDVVPYELDRTPRVFYWRPVLPPSVGNPSEWNLICATTHELSGFDALPTEGPPLVTDEGDGTTLVVGGTIGGETTKRHVESYTAPALSIDTCSDSEVRLTVDGTEYCVSNGQRRRIRLDERNVDPSEGDGGSTTVVPELVVRYPGPRELHHPPPGSTYRLFPSFNLEIDEIPNPLSIPTTADELDDATLATKLGVDLSQRPYPERVLWQAFAYTAFDPHTDTIPELTQLETGHTVVQL